VGHPSAWEVQEEQSAGVSFDLGRAILYQIRSTDYAKSTLEDDLRWLVTTQADVVDKHWELGGFKVLDKGILETDYVYPSVFLKHLMYYDPILGDKVPFVGIQCHLLGKGLMVIVTYSHPDRTNLSESELAEFWSVVASVRMRGPENQ